MRRKYGKTWWGQKWLEALSGIDNGNRLPRGRTYANTGKVKVFKIDQNRITGEVQGSWYPVYTQSIELRPWSSVERQRITELVRDSPWILSALLAKQVPQELLHELKQVGVEFFPPSWGAMRSGCSCPDRALPCKHIAAIFYLVTDEIDKDPFVLFKLRGLDLLEELQKIGLMDGGAVKLDITRFHKLFSRKTPFAQPEAPAVQELTPPDFSILKDSGESLLQLLPDEQLFYNGSLKTVFARMYKAVAKSVSTLWEAAAEAPETAPFDGQAQVQLVDDGTFDILYLHRNGETTEVGEEQGVWDVINYLQGIRPASLGHFSASVNGLYQAMQFARRLAECSAFIPELVYLGGDEYQIRWVPALLIPEVKKVFEQVLLQLPLGVVVFEEDGHLFYPPTPEAQLKLLLSVFLMEFVSQNQAISWYKGGMDDNLLDFFFAQEPIDFEEFMLPQAPQAIQRWLQKYYLGEKPWSLILKIEEAPGGFFLNFFIQQKGRELQEPVPFRKVLQEAQYRQQRQQIWHDVVVLADYLPQMKNYLQRKAEEEILLDTEEFTGVLLHTLPAFKMLGIQVLMPKSLERLTRPQLSLNIEASATAGSSGGYLNFASLLEFDWQVAIGNTRMSVAEFKKTVRRLRGVVKLNDEYVLLDDRELQSLMKKLEKPPALKPQDILQAALSEDYDGARVALGQKATTLMRQIREEPPVALPKELKAVLRPYQLRGYRWMYKNSRLGFGSLLADDMGLGKTLQVIALLEKAREEGSLEQYPALVVVPTTLLNNWEREIARFAPGLSAMVYHGPKRQLPEDGRQVVLTSYGVARSDADKLARRKWGFLVIDEAQNIKNTKTEQTKAIKKIKASIRVAMSGTPVENRLSEYWSIFDYTNKGYLHSLAQFKKAYILPIEKDRDQQQLDRFRKVTAPFILRRLKSDKSIIKDLPEKVENDQFCYLTPEQAGLYQNVLRKSLNGLEEEEGMNRRGLIFTMMTSLKQICNHPGHFLKHKDIDPALSGKMQVLFTLLDNIWESNEKTLIFTQYRQMGDLLQQVIADRYGQQPLWLHGGSTRKGRDQMVQDFQGKNHLKFMLLSLKAGGTGLNLTAASNVVHYDLWWNPAVESQATDRAYRIGQQKNVMVYRLITRNTFEEKINGLIKSKKELADLTVTSGENWITEMSNQELGELFSLNG